MINQSSERGLLIIRDFVDAFSCVTITSAVMFFEMTKNRWSLVVLVV